jgi:HlyD family secretion protein
MKPAPVPGRSGQAGSDPPQPEEADRQRRLRWIVAVAAIFLLAALGRLLWPAAETEPEGREGRATAVRVESVAIGDLALRAEYPGELVGEAADLSPRVSGRLQEVRVRVGETVRRGQTLAVVDPVELRRQLEEARGQLGTARADLERARAELQEAESLLTRSVGLYQQGLLSAQERERAEARAATTRAEVGAAQSRVAQAQARVGLLDEQVAETRLSTPFDGTVAERYLDAGALVQPGTPVVRVVRQGELLVQCRVPERELGRLTPGAALSVSTQATGEQRFAGRVLRISGEVRRSDRSALVEGVLDQAPPALRPGMYARVGVLLETLQGVTLVPGTALVQRFDPLAGELIGVFTVEAGDGDAVARWRALEILAQQGDLAAVSGELAPGEPVLTLGHEELSDGARVQVVEGSSTGPRARGGADPAGPEAAP